jgi:hypothetical protein
MMATNTPPTAMNGDERDGRPAMLAMSWNACDGCPGDEIIVGSLADLWGAV